MEIYKCLKCSGTWQVENLKPGQELKCPSCGELIVSYPKDCIPDPAPVCAVCHTPVNEKQIRVVCPACKKHYHAVCWNQNNGCAVEGCAGKIMLPPPGVDPQKTDSSGKSYETGVIYEYELQNSPEESSKTRTAFLLLAFFFGSFGVHNFYIGKLKRGLCQLGINLSASALTGILSLATGITAATASGNPSPEFSLWMLPAFLMQFGLTIWIITEMFTVKTDANGARLRKGKSGCNGCLLIFIICILVGIVGVAGLLLPALQAVRKVAQEANCTSTAKNIAVALEGYQKKTGAFPQEDGTEGWKELKTQMNMDHKAFACNSLEKSDFQRDNQSEDFKSSYLYFGANCPKNLKKSIPLAIEFPGIHPSGNVCVIYSDGHVERKKLPQDQADPLPALLKTLIEEGKYDPASVAFLNSKMKLLSNGK